MRRRRLATLLAVVGPGLVTALADTDAQGVSTYSIFGARTGYRLLWSLTLTVPLLVVTQEMGARLGVVTGQGLADLIRERFGVRVVTAAMAAMIVANFGTVVADFAGVAAAADLLRPGSRYLAVPAAALAIYLVVVKGSYRRVERVFLAVGLFMGAYAASAVLARPDWGGALRGSLVPSLPGSAGEMVAFVATVATTVTTWGQFFIQASVVDKGLGRQHLPYVRADVATAAVVSAASGWIIAVTCAATLHPRGIQVRDAAEAARALAPLTASPALAQALFSGGLLLAGALGVAVVGLATAYTACEGFGWEAGLDRSPEEAPQFYLLLRAMLGGATLLVMAPRLPLLEVMYLSNLASSAALPFILAIVLRLSSDRSLLGEHANGRLMRAAGAACVAALVAGNLALVALAAGGLG